MHRVSTREARKDYLRHLPLPSLPCTPIFVNPIRTENKSVTKPAKSTMKSVKDPLAGLHKLWYCDTMWTRLHAYVNLAVAYLHKDYDAIGGRPLHHLSECPNALEYPPPAYEAGYQQMHSIECSLYRRPQPLLCNIESVQDAVNCQILDLVNAGLQMRYENKARELAPGAAYRNTAEKKASVRDVEATCFYPAWLRSCRQNHIVNKLGTSGFTDRMLFVSPGALDVTHPKHTQVAIQEGKPPWVYTTKDFEDILEGSHNIVDEVGNFDKAEFSHPGNLLLKQLWGQCTDLGPDAGFTTNGDIVMVFFRVHPQQEPKDEPKTDNTDNTDDTDNADNIDDANDTDDVNDIVQKLKSFQNVTFQSTPELAPKFESTPMPDSGFVLSPLMEWTDHRLRACLLALSFMTLDEESWRSRKVKNNNNELEEAPVSLRDLLCPEAECTQIRNIPQ